MVSSKSSINFSSSPVSEHANVKRWRTQCTFNNVLDSSTLRNLAATPFSQPVIIRCSIRHKGFELCKTKLQLVLYQVFHPFKLILHRHVFPPILSESKSAVCRNFVSGSPVSMLWYFTNMSSCCMLEISVTSSVSKAYIPAFFILLISFSFSRSGSIMTISLKISEERTSNNKISLTPTDSKWESTWILPRQFLLLQHNTQQEKFSHKLCLP